jgi:hypothetical protein
MQVGLVPMPRLLAIASKSTPATSTWPGPASSAIARRCRDAPAGA